MRSPIDPLNLFQQWWGEPLSEELCDRAITAPIEQQQEFLAFTESARSANIPDLGRGSLRPLLINDGFNFTNFDDYYSTAATMALYVDEVAVEYTFAASPNFDLMLRYLLLMKPLAENGIIRFFEPHTQMHDYFGFGETWDQFKSVLELETSEEARLIEAADRFRSVGGIRLSAQTARYLVASQLMTKTAMPNKVNVLGRNEAEMVLFNAFARLSRVHPIDKRGYELAKLTGLRVPLYSLNISELAILRNSESAFAECRESISRALENIESLPDGSEEWREQAREIAAGELIPLQKRIEQATRASSVLTEAKTGLNIISFSAIGAAAGMLAGGDFRSDFTGAAVAGVAQVASEYWKAVKERKELVAIKDLIIAFTGSSS
jgi:hypothetical protein